MAKNKKNEAASSSVVQTQAELIINQLIQLSLMEVSKRCNLPELKIVFPEVHQTNQRQINNKLYTLEIKTDYHQILLDLTLKTKAIKALFSTHKLHQPTWAFLAYIKEEPITIEEIETNAVNLWKLADVSTQLSGKYPWSPKSGVFYHALFLVAMEDKDKLVLEEDITTAIKSPFVLSLDTISGLKAQLSSLMENAPVTASNSSSDSRIDLVANSFVQAEQAILKREKELKDLGVNEFRIRQAVSSLRDILKEHLYKL